MKICLESNIIWITLHTYKCCNSLTILLYFVLFISFQTVSSYLINAVEPKNKRLTPCPVVLRCWDFPITFTDHFQRPVFLPNMIRTRKTQTWLCRIFFVWKWGILSHQNRTVYWFSGVRQNINALSGLCCWTVKCWLLMDNTPSLISQAVLSCMCASTRMPRLMGLNGEREREKVYDTDIYIDSASECTWKAAGCFTVHAVELQETITQQNYFNLWLKYRILLFLKQ